MLHMATTHHQEGLDFSDPDLSDRLDHIWTWMEFRSAAEAAGDERNVNRANIWLCRHRLALYRDAA